MKNLFLSVALIIILISCEKEKNSDSPVIFNAGSGGVFISNEGNFQSGNSSVSYFNPSDGALYSDAYKQVNHQSLGDICQSMKIINNKLYIIVNNSGKIEVCIPSSMQHTTTISGFTSPRYILQVNNSKAYVSDAYANHLSIVNLDNNSVSGTIALNGWSEQMLMKNNLIYVTDMSSDYLYIIDPSNDIVSDSILISKGANSICEDRNGRIWVLCGGDYLLTYNGSLYRIDPSTKQIESNIPFSPNEFPGKLCINGTNDTLFFLNNGLWRISITDSALSGSPFIASSGKNFYGLGIEKIKNEIYISDAIDYNQQGTILRYRADGSAIGNFKAGINPGDFLFLP